MIAPDVLVTQIHPAFTPAAGFNDRRIHIDGGKILESLALAAPYLQAHCIDGPLQRVNMVIQND